MKPPRGLAALLLLMTPAAAAASPPDLWHVGVNARTELGVHPLRLGAGVQRGAWDLTVVLDPMVLTDGEHDLDLIGQRRLGHSRWTALGGLRWTAIGIADGRQSQDRLFVGVGAPLAGGDGTRFQVRWAVEASMLIVKHGAGLPTAWVSLASNRDYVDRVALGMFVTVDHASLL